MIRGIRGTQGLRLSELVVYMAEVPPACLRCQSICQEPMAHPLSYWVDYKTDTPIRFFQHLPSHRQPLLESTPLTCVALRSDTKERKMGLINPTLGAIRPRDSPDKEGAFP